MSNLDILILFLMCLVQNEADQSEKRFRRESSFSDTTRYSYKEMCGNLEINYDSLCSCDGEKFQPGDSDKYCCVNGNNKCKDVERTSNVQIDGYCPNGVVKNKSESCQNRCYNDYDNSEYLSENAHYHCPDEGKCIKLRDMCQGIRYCLTDVERCDDSLRCINLDYHTGPYSNKSLYTELVKGHHFCLFEKGQINDGSFDAIDRSDEDDDSNITSVTDKVDQLDLQVCSDGLGIKCVDGCRRNYDWCTNEKEEGCKLNKKDETQITISVNNRNICGDHSFWEDKSCKSNDQGAVAEALGLRCYSAFQHCFYPWYTLKEGIPKNYLPNCYDKSDQKFPIHHKCSDFNEKFAMNHTNNFCEYEENAEICSDKMGWYSKQKDPLIKDPHGCQNSCEDPSRPDCISCTNTKDFFHCTKSGVCINMENKCDGHPNCPGVDGELAEDEKDCLGEYLRKNIVQEYATLVCRTKQYEGM